MAHITKTPPTKFTTTSFGAENTEGGRLVKKLSRKVKITFGVSFGLILAAVLWGAVNEGYKYRMRQVASEGYHKRALERTQENLTPGLVELFKEQAFTLTLDNLRFHSKRFINKTQATIEDAAYAYGALEDDGKFYLQKSASVLEKTDGKRQVRNEADFVFAARALTKAVDHQLLAELGTLSGNKPIEAAFEIEVFGFLLDGRECKGSLDDLENRKEVVEHVKSCYHIQPTHGYVVLHDKAGKEKSVYNAVCKDREEKDGKEKDGKKKDIKKEECSLVPVPIPDQYKPKEEAKRPVVTPEDFRKGLNSMGKGI